MKKDLYKKCLFLAFIVILITVVLSLTLKYNVEGEKKLPYSIEKILVVSSISAKDNLNTENLWDFNLMECNDIFIYFQKNTNSKEPIKEIKVNNFKIETAPKFGNVNLYKPTGEIKDLYKYSETNLIKDGITFFGAKTDNPQALEFANNGGMIEFRLSLNDIANFVSNDENEKIIKDASLITKSGLNLEDIEFSISFDLFITLENNVTYKGNISLELPTKDILENPKSHKEISDFSNIIFKRVTDKETLQ